MPSNVIVWFQILTKNLDFPFFVKRLGLSSGNPLATTLSVSPSSKESMTCNTSPSLTSATAEIPRDHESTDLQHTMSATERRLSRRLNLRWRLRLSSPSIGMVETKTENLSSRGFYCYLESPLVPGDVVTCTITMPNYMGSTNLTYSLVCQAEVIRIEAVGPVHGFGVAWKINDFSLERRQNAFSASSR